LYVRYKYTQYRGRLPNPSISHRDTIPQPLSRYSGTLPSSECLGFLFKTTWLLLLFGGSNKGCIIGMMLSLGPNSSSIFFVKRSGRLRQKAQFESWKYDTGVRSYLPIAHRCAEVVLVLSSPNWRGSGLFPGWLESRMSPNTNTMINIIIASHFHAVVHGGAFT
jgi:hypothetical protein